MSYPGEEHVKRWRLAHPDKLAASRKRCSDRLYKARRKMLDAIKLKSGCIDCGYNKAPEALQFDHIDPPTKNLGVGQASMAGLKRLMAEIDKCVIRCANCHAIKTKRLNEHGRYIGGRKIVI